MKACLVVLSLFSFLFMSSCSNALKKRQEQREKVAASTGLFCDFVSGDDHKDVDVELNFSMAKRCDSNKNFSVTSYKSSAEVNGLIYCCAVKRPEPKVAAAPPAAAPKAAPVKAAPKPAEPVSEPPAGAADEAPVQAN